MIDHTKYDEIHVTTLTSDDQYANHLTDSIDKKIKGAINRLIVNGYDIIDIKQNFIVFGDSSCYTKEQHYAFATIYYGKPKTNKK